jgi:hypothetical protein
MAIRRPSPRDSLTTTTTHELGETMDTASAPQSTLSQHDQLLLRAEQAYGETFGDYYNFKLDYRTHPIAPQSAHDVNQAIRALSQKYPGIFLDIKHVASANPAIENTNPNYTPWAAIKNDPADPDYGVYLLQEPFRDYNRLTEDLYNAGNRRTFAWRVDLTQVSLRPIVYNSFGHLFAQRIFDDPVAKQELDDTVGRFIGTPHTYQSATASHEASQAELLKKLGVSDYGSRTPRNLVAEMFAQYNLAEDSSPLARTVGQIVDKYVAEYAKELVSSPLAREAQEQLAGLAADQYSKILGEHYGVDIDYKTHPIARESAREINHAVRMLAGEYPRVFKDLGRIHTRPFGNTPQASLRAYSVTDQGPGHGIYLNAEMFTDCGKLTDAVGDEVSKDYSQLNTPTGVVYREFGKHCARILDDPTVQQQLLTLCKLYKDQDFEFWPDDIQGQLAVHSQSIMHYKSVRPMAEEFAYAPPTEGFADDAPARMVANTFAEYKLVPLARYKDSFVQGVGEIIDDRLKGNAPEPAHTLHAVQQAQQLTQHRTAEYSAVHPQQPASNPNTPQLASPEGPRRSARIAVRLDAHNVQGNPPSQRPTTPGR